MIEAKGLWFRYPNSESFVLKNISFKIAKGSHVALLGHNGSGKSTLSKLIINTYRPTRGELLIGDDTQTFGEKRPKIGIVFQNPDNQFVGGTVEDDIAFGLENKMVDPQRIREIVLEISKKVNMHEFLEHEPHNLSGGQKQRVAIASALSLDPDIIIFDEATSMLDPKGKSEVLDIIEEIKSTRTKTLISITHDMDEAILADWVLVFSDGELIAQGKPQEVFLNFETLDKAKIDKPFIYKVSENIRGLKPTFELTKIIDYINKNKK